MIHPLGRWRYRHLLALPHLDPKLIERVTAEYEAGTMHPNGRLGVRVDLWVDDWWQIAWGAAASNRRNPELAPAVVNDVRAWGRKMIGRLSRLEAHPGYRGYAVIGDRQGPLLEGWIGEGSAKPWPGRHMVDGPARPVYLVPRVQMWRGGQLTMWHAKEAKDELWRLHVGAEQLG